MSDRQKEQQSPLAAINEQQDELTVPEFDLVLSKFVYNFAHIFTEMHSILAEQPENLELVRFQVLESSRELRDALTQVDGLPEELGEFAMVIQLVWHLTEIFMLNSTPYTMLEMIDWLKSLVVLTSDIIPLDDAVLRNIYKSNAPEMKDEYWDILHELVQAGEMRSAWEVLKAHSLMRDAARSSTGSRQIQEAFQQLQQIFTTSPLYEFETKLENVDEFRAGYARHWADWSATVDRYLYGATVFDPRVTDLIQTMAHDFTPSADSEWHNALLRDLMYKYPKLTKRELSYVTQSWLEKCTGKDQRFAAIRTYIDVVLDGDAAAVLGKLWKWDVSVHVSDESTGFFKELCAVHLAELMDQLQLLGHSQRESFVVRYASDLWQLGFPMEIVIPYLASCKNQGAQKRNELLRKRTIASDRDAERVLTICQQLSRVDAEPIEQLLCDARAEYWYGRQKFGKAMSWWLRIHDHDAILRLCDEVGVTCMAAIAAFHSLRYQITQYKIGPPIRKPAVRDLYVPHFDQPKKDILYHDLQARQRIEAALHAVDAVLSAATQLHSETYPFIRQLNQYRDSVGDALGGAPRHDDFGTNDQFAIAQLEQKCQRLQSAGEGILDLIEDPTYPMRHSLHLIDLACRIDGWYKLLREHLTRLDSNIPFQPLFSHLEVQALLVGLQSLMCSHHRPDFVEGMSSLDMMDLHYNLNHMLVTSISYNRFERDAARDADLLRPLREAPTRRRVPLNLRREHVQKSSAAEDLTIAPRSISLLL